MPATKKTSKTSAKTKKPTTSTKAKRPSRKPTTTRLKKAATPQSFKVYSDETPFLTFRITRQTIYWIILSAAILALGYWTFYIHQQVQEIYDQIDASHYQQVQIDERQLDLMRKSHDKQ